MLWCCFVTFKSGCVGNQGIVDVWMWCQSGNCRCVDVGNQGSWGVLVVQWSSTPLVCCAGHGAAALPAHPHQGEAALQRAIPNWTCTFSVAWHTAAWHGAGADTPGFGRLVRNWECRLWDAGAGCPADLLLLLLMRVSNHPSQGGEHLCFVCSIHIA